MERMTAEAFEALRPHIGRLALDTVQLAREVLVDGVSQSDVARKFNVSRQRVHGAVVRVMAAANDVPKGWEKVELWLPPELAAQARAMEVEARKTVES